MQNCNWEKEMTDGQLTLQRDLSNQLIFELGKTGITTDQLLAAAHLRGYTGTDRVEFAGLDSMALLEAAAELTQNPALALRLGQEIDIDSYGTFGFALMSCANLRESNLLMRRYGEVFTELNWEYYDHDGGLLLRLDLIRGTAAQQQLAIELCFSQLSRIGSSMHRGRIEGAEIQFSYPEPTYSARYKSVFNTVIKFDCEHNQLYLPPEALDMPVKTADPAEHVFFHQQCEEMLRGLKSSEKTTNAVRRLLIQSAGEFPDISQVADCLHISERTLRRHLKAESTSFRATFDEIRDLLAKEYLTKTELTVADIAHLLDYSETVNFRRAFVRWNSATPSQYRQQ